MEDLSHISPLKPLGRALCVQGQCIAQEELICSPCYLPSPLRHTLTKEPVVNGLETPTDTSAYANRGFLCTSEGTGCSQNVEGCPSKRHGIFLGRNWDGHIETVYQFLI